MNENFPLERAMCFANVRVERGVNEIYHAQITFYVFLGSIGPICMSIFSEYIA